MSLIEVHGVFYYYKGRKALSNVSLSIDEGSFIVVLGHSGAGKSTLARILNSTLKPNRGSVDSGKVPLRSLVGLVLQNPDSQIMGDTVEEDVAFALENMGLEPDEMERRIEASLSAVGLSAYRFSDPRKLSGGQKQLLAIACVLAMETRCIVLDEALSMLDCKTRADVLCLLGKLAREKGVAVVLLGHSADDAAMADVVHIMQDGSIVASGKPSDVFSSPEAQSVLSVSFVSRLKSALRSRGVDVPASIVDQTGLLSHLTGKGASDA